MIEAVHALDGNGDGIFVKDVISFSEYGGMVILQLSEVFLVAKSPCEEVVHILGGDALRTILLVTFHVVGECSCICPFEGVAYVVFR